MRLTTAAAVIAFAASILAAPTAGADSTDAGFINDLRQITDPSLRTLVDAAPSLLISTGRKVCSMLDQGYGFQAVEGMILDKLHLQGNSNTYYAGLFGVYAVADYCPAHQADSGFNGQY
jgi:hypothetical protein